jgi:hypothetical protein
MTPTTTPRLTLAALLLVLTLTVTACAGGAADDDLADPGSTAGTDEPAEDPDPDPAGPDSATDDGVAAIPSDEGGTPVAGNAGDTAKPAPAKPPTTKPVTTKPATTTPATTTPAPQAPAAEPDGTWPARIVRAVDGTVTVDRVEVLSGPEATAARIEDGVEVDETADIPYVRNRNPKLRHLPVADDVVVRAIDCSGACALAPWSYAAIVAGTPLPYGPADALFTVRVRNGQVVELSEVYFA